LPLPKEQQKRAEAKEKKSGGKRLNFMPSREELSHQMGDQGNKKQLGYASAALG